MDEFPIAERREAFLAMLGRIPEENWRYRTWFESEDGTECGTHACAVGWAPLDDTLAKMGFGMADETDNVVFGKANIFALFDEVPRRPRDLAPTYDGELFDTAAAKFLALPFREASQIFAGRYDDEILLAGGGPVTAQMVMARLKKAFEDHPV